MNEETRNLDVMMNNIVTIAERNGSISAAAIKDIFLSYGCFGDYLSKLSDKRLEKIDKLFDYEKNGFECFTLPDSDKKDSNKDRTVFIARDDKEIQEPFRGRIFLSIKDDSLELVIEEVVKFLVDSKIYAHCSIANRMQNDSMIISLAKQDDIIKLSSFLQSNIISKHFKETTPVIPTYGGIGYVNYSSRGDYISKLSEYLSTFVNQLNKKGLLDRFSLEYFCETLDESYQTGRIPASSGVSEIVEATTLLNTKLNSMKK